MKTAVIASILISLSLIAFVESERVAPAFTEEVSVLTWTEADADKVEKVLGKSDKITVVDFWASWCGPCRNSFPETVKLSKNKNLRVVTISLDKLKGTEAGGLNFLKSQRADDCINLLYTGDLSSFKDNYAFPGYIPYMIIVDKKGNIHPYSDAALQELLK